MMYSNRVEINCLFDRDDECLIDKDILINRNGIWIKDNTLNFNKNKNSANNLNNSTNNDETLSSDIENNGLGI